MRLRKPHLSPAVLVSKLRQPGMFSTLLRGTGIVFMAQACGTGVGYILQICLARWMGPTEYGFYTYLMAWTYIGSMFAAMGFGPSLLRFVPEYHTKQDEGRLKGVIRGSLVLTLGSSLLLALVGTGVVLWLNASRGIDQMTAILLALWSIPLLTTNRLTISVLRGIRKMVAAYAPTRVLRPTLILLGSLGVFAAQGYDSLSSAAVMAVTIAALFIVEVVAGLVAERSLSHNHQVRPTYDLRGWLRVSLPLLLIGSFVKVLKQTDVLMIGLLLTAGDVGFYNAAVKTSNLAGFALSSVSGIAAPMIAATYAEGNPVKLQRLMNRVSQIVVLPSLLVTIGLVVLARPILWTFGPDFVQAQWCLIILAIAQFIRASTGPAGHLLELTGHQDESARARAGSAFTNIALNLIGISLFGIVGAALATAMAILLERVWIDRLVARHIRINASVFSQLANTSNPSEVGESSAAPQDPDPSDSDPGNPDPSDSDPKDDP